MKRYYKLIFKSMKARRKRSFALILTAFILSLVIVFGSLMTLGMKKGSKSVADRMGADLIVVPEGSGKDLEGILLTTEKSFFYMDNTVLDQIRKTEGVEKASPQTFLLTMEASCCDQAVQIVGMDPESDFTLTPWMEGKDVEKLKKGAVIVGGRINVREDHTFQMFHRIVPVAASLAESGSSMDVSIYIDRSEIPGLMQAAKEAGQGILGDIDTESISAVMVKVAEKEKKSAVVARLSRIEGIEVITSDSVVGKLSRELKSAYILYVILIGTLLILGFVILYVIYYVTINERKKELMSLRIMGMSRRMVKGFLFGETLLTSGIGAISGAFFGILSFSLLTQWIVLKIGFPFAIPGFRTALPVFAAGILLTACTGPFSAWRTAGSVCGEDIIECE